MCQVLFAALCYCTSIQTAYMSQLNEIHTGMLEQDANKVEGTKLFARTLFYNIYERNRAFHLATRANEQ